MDSNVGNAFVLREEDGRMHITLRDALTIVQVSEVRDALARALATRTHTVIDISDLEDVDVAGLQLLCSAHRSAAGAGVPLDLTGASRAFNAAVEAAGFRHLEGCSDETRNRCLWMAGADEDAHN
jgi:anti-anti-sigma factor